ncbi:signal recognition particle receptor subunit alpha [Sporobolomyces koalae]|uniref:signal recognition particle receptor subunit alpha n=1 Tax=Sporobolomyces koalae TaxID=500713 RepID=UPI00316D9C36
MLDHFTILTLGGVVLWSRSFTTSPSPVDALIREALIEERASTALSSTNISRYDKDQSTVLYSFENSLALELVFVVSYQRILNLAYPTQLVTQAKHVFVKHHAATVQALKSDMTTGASQVAFEWTGWAQQFDQLLRELESQEAIQTKRSKPRTSAAAASPRQVDIDLSAESTPSETPNPSVPDASTGSPDAQTIARNIAALKARQKAAARSSRSAKRSSGTDTDSNAGSESDASASSPIKPKKGPTKSATKWADSPLSAADLAAYDYSSSSTTPMQDSVDASSLVSKAALGTRDEQSGMYEVADYAVASTDGDDDDDEVEPATAASSSFASFFSRLSLSSGSTASKTLTKSDLAPILQQMQSHLTAKNVAAPISQKLVESVGLSLEGKSLESTSVLGLRNRAIKRQVREAFELALTKVLTPKTSTDLLLEIQRKRQRTNLGSTTTTRSSKLATTATSRGGDPYAITFVGVNGVGKSTNLSKVAFWLLQNHLKVLIAACDTFRSGAVEQLRVHVRNLGKLDAGQAGGQVELFEKGYGKDAAGIAKDALTYAKQNDFDVVLIDTAGRMQDNEPLMRALAKLISVNQPDKIIFVGEALVGNEAVDQLTKFDQSLKNFSASGGTGSGMITRSGGGGGGERKEARGIDGMILTKFDTIDDKVGAALSMTYTTGQPIYFVGCGQTYSDLRMLRVGHIVQALLQD